MQLFMTNKKKKKPKQKYYNSFLYEFFKAIFQNAIFFSKKRLCEILKRLTLFSLFVHLI